MLKSSVMSKRPTEGMNYGKAGKGLGTHLGQGRICMLGCQKVNFVLIFNGSGRVRPPVDTPLQF